MTNQIAHKDFFNAPAVQQRFAEVLKGNEKQFTASLLSIVGNNNLLSKASNASVMTAAMKAAVLNLPIEPSLGFAYIVPYKGQAQFQLGYKGLIQLAIRSGQFKGINAGVIYKAQLRGYDPLFETLDVDFTQPQDEVAGYFASFELVNGFKKLTYWTKEEAEAHGKRFSQSFAKGPWKTDFDAMAQKTVLKSILSRYAPLSTEMQNAISADNEDTTFEQQVPKDVTETSSQDLLADMMQAGLPPTDPETGEIMSEEEPF